MNNGAGQFQSPRGPLESRAGVYSAAGQIGISKPSKWWYYILVVEFPIVIIHLKAYFIHYNA